MFWKLYLTSKCGVNVGSISFQPAGKISAGNLCSPEAELLTAPLTVELLNAFHSLIDRGLTWCEGGLATRSILPTGCYGGSGIYENLMERSRANSLGPLMLPLPANRTVEGLVDQLDLLLTGGRLSPRTRSFINDAVSARSFAGITDPGAEAQRLVAKLIIGSAEFRTQADSQLKDTGRPASQVTESQGRGYRATIMIYADGGMVCSKPRWHTLPIGAIPHSTMLIPGSVCRTPQTCSSLSKAVLLP